MHFFRRRNHYHDISSITSTHDPYPAAATSSSPTTSRTAPPPPVHKFSALTSRQYLILQILSAFHTDPSLVSVCTTTVPSPPSLHDHHHHLLDSLPCDRPFPYGVSRASDSLSIAVLRSHSLRASPASSRQIASKSTVTMREFLHTPSAHQSSSSFVFDDLSEHPSDSHPISDSQSSLQPYLNKSNAQIPRSPLSPQSPPHSAKSLSISPPSPHPHAFRPSLSPSEEDPLPPQLPPVPSAKRPPYPHRLHATFAHRPRHAHTPTSFNPFATAYLQPPPNTLDVCNNLTLDVLPSLLPTIRASILLPFSTVPPHHHPHFISLIHGTRPPSSPFIFEPFTTRIWQEDTTWRKEIRGTKPIAQPSAPLDGLSEARAGGHPHWPYLIAAALARMLAVSSGLLQRGHECLRAIVGLQTIREMLRLRHVIRAALRRLTEHAGTFVALNGYGAFAVAPDGWLTLDGCDRPELTLIDPTTWRTRRDVATALMTWTNIETDVVTDAHALLSRLRLTVRAVPHWCRAALQFSAAHDIDSAIALVGIIRLLFVRKWRFSTGGVAGRACGGGDDGNACGSASGSGSGAEHLFCANEFVDLAVAVPELEKCMPVLLDVERFYAGGHDIDCGALTRLEVVEAGHVGSMGTVRRKTSWLNKGNVADDVMDDDMDTRSISSWSLVGLRRRRIVMSVWTDELNGSEWYVPRVMSPSIDFKLDGLKYRLAITRGEVVCQRVGTRVWLRRRRKDGVNGFAIRSRGNGMDVDMREASGSVALCNAFDRIYGDRVCFQVLGWLQRGLIRLNDMCSAASFVPRRCLGGSLVVNRRLPFEVCRRMVFGRRAHELYWVPGDGLPCFRVTDCANGSYQLTEMRQMPLGVELCRSEISKDFG